MIDPVVVVSDQAAPVVLASWPTIVIPDAAAADDEYQSYLFLLPLQTKPPFARSFEICLSSYLLGYLRPRSPAGNHLLMLLSWGCKTRASVGGVGGNTTKGCQLM